MVVMADITVARNDERQRYEAMVDGTVAGSALFRSKPGVTNFYHTEVDPAFEGKGVGSVLARRALDDVRARGEKVVADCPFIAGWIKRHPDYQDLLAQT
jgi:predicted GNAT family acetyltransferase